ncbi:hypothetical protein E1K68_03620 [Pseudomonas sp. B2021]|nr:hypothetical protein [Pseudomonas sp. B2021]
MGDPLGSKVRVGGAQLPRVVMVAASGCPLLSLTAGVGSQKPVEQVMKVHGMNSVSDGPIIIRVRQFGWLIVLMKLIA